MKKEPHKHAALIKLWADGAVIQRRLSCDTERYEQPVYKWVNDDSPGWYPDEMYRVLPMPNYPKSTLDYGELCDLVNASRKIESHEGFETLLARVVADRAVANFIHSGGIELWKKECEARGECD